MSKADVSKHEPTGGIEITQSDLLQAASSMGPSVSDSERHRYQAMYVVNKIMIISFKVTQAHHHHSLKVTSTFQTNWH